MTTPKKDLHLPKILRAFDLGDGNQYAPGDEAKLAREQSRHLIVRMAALGYVAMPKAKAGK